MVEEATVRFSSSDCLGILLESVSKTSYYTKTCRSRWPCSLKVRLDGASFRAAWDMRLEADWGMQRSMRQTCAHGQAQVLACAPHTEWTSSCVTLCNTRFCTLISCCCRIGLILVYKWVRIFNKGLGETGFSWHTFHSLIFYNFHTNDTKKKVVLVARVILRLCKKI
jgi:hypothetical protein